MGRLGIGVALVLAGALGCGRVAQRVVEEEDTATNGGKAQGGRGGSPNFAGTSSGGMGAVANAPATGGVGGVVEPACGGAPNPLPLQALSSWEYARSVEHALRIETTEPFPASAPFGSPFSFSMFFGHDSVETLVNLAETYGEVAGTTLKQPCVEAVVNDACARTIIEPLLQRAFRRAEKADVERYLALFKLGATDGDWEGGLRLLTEGLLLSPSFLFKWYPGKASNDATTRLTSFEIASRLSFFLTGSPPSSELLQAAANDELQTDAGIEQQARRIVESGGLSRQAPYFYSQWLGLYQLDNQVGPELSAEELTSMRVATESFVSDVFGSDRSWSTLLVGHPEALDSARSISGLLTERSTLVRWNSPTYRGKFVRERMLCMPVPAPPPNISTQPPEIQPGQTRRDAWIQHRSDPACASCHMLMDPIGFAFENYDALGVYRSLDNGQPVDNSGELLVAGDVEGPFVGPDELKRRLLDSRTVGECQAGTWLSFALQRELLETDSCFVQQAYAALANSDLDLGELIVRIAVSTQFRTRDHYDGASGPPLLKSPPALPPLAIGPKARRNAVLGFAIEEAMQLAAAVSPEDRPLVDQYLTSLREVQVSLGNIP